MTDSAAGTSWSDRIARWKEIYGCSTLEPVPEETRRASRAALRADSFADLNELFKVSNGVFCDWFEVLPVEDRRDVKHTWDSINRANRVETTRFLVGQRHQLERFLVFAQLSGARCALLDRADGSIWFEEEGQISQTDLRLEEFIELNLRDATGL